MKNDISVAVRSSVMNGTLGVRKFVSMFLPHPRYPRLIVDSVLELCQIK